MPRRRQAPASRAAGLGRLRGPAAGAQAGSRGLRAEQACGFVTEQECREEGAGSWIGLWLRESQESASLWARLLSWEEERLGG